VQDEPHVARQPARYNVGSDERLRSGLVLVWKRLEHSTFRWPPITDGVMRLSPAQMAALFDGMDWSRLHARDVARPTATS